MIKIHINLLPRDIKDKQKTEKYVFLAIFGIVVFAVLLGGLYAYNTWRIRNAENEVSMLKRQTAKMEAAIQSLKVYEQKLKEVQDKKAILDKAISGQIVWSKTLEELMVVTPSDVSLVSLSGNSDGITFNGQALDINDNPDLGHKPVANWLTQLAKIHPEPEVWLTSSDKQANVINFVSTVKFKKMPMLPAPSNPSGK
ncbi:MAG: hypothetical protein K6T91_04010 [Firmicutes bacterium]|nr:hypothetical protein [Bacillota bacterium]